MSHRAGSRNRNENVRIHLPQQKKKKALFHTASSVNRVVSLQPYNVPCFTMCCPRRQNSKKRTSLLRGRKMCRHCTDENDSVRAVASALLRETETNTALSQCVLIILEIKRSCSAQLSQPLASREGKLIKRGALCFWWLLICGHRFETPTIQWRRLSLRFCVCTFGH